MDTETEALRKRSYLEDLNRASEDLTITIFFDSAGDYQYHIYAGSPEEAAGDTESLDGGACTSNMANAIDMACQQAKDLIGRTRRKERRRARRSERQSIERTI